MSKNLIESNVGIEPRPHIGSVVLSSINARYHIIPLKLRQEDLNLRPARYQRVALPDCAMPQCHLF